MKGLLKKILAGGLSLAMCISLAACTPPTNPPDNPDDGTITETATTFVGIDINPSVEMTLDENGAVITVYGANEDGQILLYEEEAAIVGKSYEEAVDYITGLAVELGYLSAENPDVSTTVTSDSANVEEIKNKISSKITAKADTLGISVTVDSETAFEILRELDALKEKYPDNTAIQGLTPDKYKLAVRATEGGDITITAAAELDTAELIEKVKGAHATLEKYATEAYLVAKAKANAIFDTASGVFLDGVYTTVYAARVVKLLTNPSYVNTMHLGAMYQAYKTTERTYRAVESLIEFADEYTDLAIDSALVAQLADELGVEDSSVFEDENGNVTVKSVSAYCNKLIREGELSGELKDTVEDILDEAEDAAELVVMAGERFDSELNTLKSSIEQVINAVTTASGALISFLPAEAKAEFEACLADLNAAKVKLGEVIENGITEDEIEQLADEAEEKAEDVLERINADLTDEEKASVEASKSALQSSIQTLKDSFNGALESAENDAKSYIEDKKNERKESSAD